MYMAPVNVLNVVFFFLLSAFFSIGIDASSKRSGKMKSPEKTKSSVAPQPEKVSPSSPKGQIIKLTRSAPLQDFLVGPEDFVRDADVNYLANQLHRPEVIEKFYLSARQVYADLPAMYRELQADEKLAQKIMEDIKILAISGLEFPLTTTNLIFAAGKHFLPIFPTQSAPIVEIAQAIATMEKEEKPRLISLMTQFFMHYTVREVGQVQDFITLFSKARLRSPKDEASKKLIEKSGYVDINSTSLEEFSEKICITVANCIAKMVILLDLFLSDPTVTDRTVRLVNKVWSLHLSRLAKQEGIPVADLDISEMDPRLFRKEAINFSFADWSPDGITEETMTELRNAIEDAKVTKEAIKAARAKKQSMESFKNYSIILVVVLLLCFIIVFFIYRRRQRLRAQKMDQIDLVSYDYNSEIVGNLEDSLRS